VHFATSDPFLVWGGIFIIVAAAAVAGVAAAGAAAALKAEHRAPAGALMLAL